MLAGGADYRIVDVAGEGAPLVGVVERRGAALWLRPTRGPARRLTGPLAVPRIAGPGYKVWVVGRAGADGSLVARRLGVLAPPRYRAGSARSAARRGAGASIAPGAAAASRYSCRMSLSASVPRDSAEGRAFLQCRIALFARVLFFLDFGFFALVRCPGAEGGDVRPRASSWCRASWPTWPRARCWRSSGCSAGAASARPPRSTWIDAGGFILVGLFYALMGADPPGDEARLPRALSGAFASLVMIIAFTNTLIGRAVLVPSSPRRTFWIAGRRDRPDPGGDRVPARVSAPG